MAWDNLVAGVNAGVQNLSNFNAQQLEAQRMANEKAYQEATIQNALKGLGIQQQSANTQQQVAGANIAQTEAQTAAMQPGTTDAQGNYTPGGIDYESKRVQNELNQVQTNIMSGKQPTSKDMFRGWMGEEIPQYTMVNGQMQFKSADQINADLDQSYQRAAALRRIPTEWRQSTADEKKPQPITANALFNADGSVNRSVYAPLVDGAIKDTTGSSLGRAFLLDPNMSPQDKLRNATMVANDVMNFVTNVPSSQRTALTKALQQDVYDQFGVQPPTTPAPAASPQPSRQPNTGIPLPTLNDLNPFAPTTIPQNIQSARDKIWQMQHTDPAAQKLLTSSQNQALSDAWHHLLGSSDPQSYIDTVNSIYQSIGEQKLQQAIANKGNASTAFMNRNN
jgi:hypothetical protein